MACGAFIDIILDLAGVGCGFTFAMPGTLIGAAPVAHVRHRTPLQIFAGSRGAARSFSQEPMTKCSRTATVKARHGR
jgi:hypothetical protein